MTRTAVGAVSITDIKDGIHPISMVLSNQSHTFAADTAGTVTSGERGKFSCEIFAYIGDTRATYDSAATPANNTYKVTVVNSSGWAHTKTTTSNQLIITASTVPGGVTNKSGTFSVTVEIKNYLGNITTIDAVISLAKAVEGTNGAIVELTPSRQTFQFDENGSSTDGDIVIPVRAAGNVGSLSAYYATNGNNTWTALAIGTTANKAKTIDIDGSGGNDQIVISKANFGTNDVMSIKVEGLVGGADVVSIMRIQDGNTGAAAIIVNIKSNNNGFVFKNNAGATKTLTAYVFDMADGSEITTGLTYQWEKNGATLAGKTAKTIAVTASDIADNSSDQYSCVVTSS